MTDEPNILSSRKTLRQFFTCAFIGMLKNVLGYVIYLIPTYLLGAPKSTMTALYFVEVSIGFLANQRLTFRHDGDIGVTRFRYLLANLRLTQF